MGVTGAGVVPAPPRVQLVLEDDARGLTIDSRPERVPLRPGRRAARPTTRHAAQAPLRLERGQALVAHRDRQRRDARRAPRPSRAPPPPSRPRVPFASTGRPTTSSETPCSSAHPADRRGVRLEGRAAVHGGERPRDADARVRDRQPDPARAEVDAEHAAHHERPVGGVVGSDRDGRTARGARRPRATVVRGCSISRMVAARSEPRRRGTRTAPPWARASRAPGRCRAMESTASWTMSVTRCSSVGTLLTKPGQSDELAPRRRARGSPAPLPPAGRGPAGGAPRRPRVAPAWPHPPR